LSVQPVSKPISAARRPARSSVGSLA